MNVISEVHGHRVLTHTPDKPTFGSESDALDVIGHAFGEEATVIAVPADLVADDFFTLSTRVAGDVVLKFTNYRLRLAIVGDISERLAASDSLRAFVHETNKGRDIWFVADADELASQLARMPAAPR